MRVWNKQWRDMGFRFAEYERDLQSYFYPRGDGFIFLHHPRLHVWHAGHRNCRAAAAPRLQHLDPEWFHGAHFPEPNRELQRNLELAKRSEEHTSELQSHSFISYAVG